MNLSPVLPQLMDGIKLLVMLNIFFFTGFFCWKVMTHYPLRYCIIRIAFFICLVNEKPLEPRKYKLRHQHVRYYKRSDT